MLSYSPGKALASSSVKFVDLDRSFREYISVFAHESQSKYSSLDHLDRERTIHYTWKNEFLHKKLGPERNLTNREIDLRFVFQKNEVVRSFT